MFQKGHNKEIMTFGNEQLQIHIPIDHFLAFWDEYTENNPELMKMLLYIFKKSTPAGQGLIFEMQLMEYLGTASNENQIIL